MSALSMRSLSTRSWLGRPLVSLLVATVGYGLTFWAWTLIGPLGWAPERQPGVGEGPLMLLAAVLVRDRPDRRSWRGGHWRIGLGVLRLPATRYLSAWYAIAFGGLVALGLYLPAYLRHVYHLPGNRAVLVTAACLTVAATSRPVGGWLCQRQDPVPVLRACFAGSAVV